MNGRRLLTTTLLITLLAAGAAAAQDGRWLLGLDGLSSYIGDNNEEDAVSIDEQSGGAALQFGYRFSPNFMLRLYAGGASHPTNVGDIEIALISSLIEGVYIFRDGRAFRPYLFGGLGGFKVESRHDDLVFGLEGGGVSFGAGAHYLLGDTVSLHGSLRLEAINWNTAAVSLGGSTIEAPVEESGSASKVTFGVAFWL